MNYTPNAFWHAVQKFDVKVTGTAKPTPEPEVIEVSEPEPEIVEKVAPKPKSKSQTKRVRAQSTK